MALYDDPPHRVNVQTLATGTDAGGGVSNTYTTVQTACPCSINTASSSERELFSQPNQTVSHTVAFLSATLTTPLTRGMKLVAPDQGVSLHVLGISTGRAYGPVPAFTMAYCESLN